MSTTFKTGDRVRVRISPDEGSLPSGSVGTILTDTFGPSEEADKNLNFVRFEEASSPLLFGDGWPLYSEELDLVTSDEQAG